MNARHDFKSITITLNGEPFGQPLSAPRYFTPDPKPRPVLELPRRVEGSATITNPEATIDVYRGTLGGRRVVMRAKVRGRAAWKHLRRAFEGTKKQRNAYRRAFLASVIIDCPDNRESIARVREQLERAVLGRRGSR